MRRGQGALEYLITYGWAILIIVIVGGALFALGIFNPSTWGTNKRATGFSSLQIEDWKLDSTGNLTLIVGNKFGREITVWIINATRSGTAGNCDVTIGSPGTLLSLDATGTQLTSTDGDCLTGLGTGDAYTLSVQVIFSAGSLNHTDSGVITGKME